MIKLYGAALSNYFALCKMALIEKGIEFEEVMAPPSQDPAWLEKSPMGKIPALETDQGFLTESGAILEYVDRLNDSNPLFPSDPWERAKTLELIYELFLYIDVPIRPLFPEAFFGKSVSDKTKEVARKGLERGLAALKRRTRFEPYIAGAQFTAADMVAFLILRVVNMVTEGLYQWNVTKEIPGYDEWAKLVAERESTKQCIN